MHFDVISWAISYRIVSSLLPPFTHPQTSEEANDSPRQMACPTKCVRLTPAVYPLANPQTIEEANHSPKAMVTLRC